MIKRSFAIILVILITIEIFWFSSLPGTSTQGTNPWISRIYHFSVFFLFTFFLLAAIKGKKNLRPLFIIITLIISVVHAILDEVHQYFVPMRQAVIGDVLTDIVGILVATLIFYFISSKTKSKKQI